MSSVLRNVFARQEALRTVSQLARIQTQRNSSRLVSCGGKRGGYMTVDNKGVFVRKDLGTASGSVPRSFSTSASVHHSVGERDTGASESAATQPDGQATTMSDEYEYKKLLRRETDNCEATTVAGATADGEDSERLFRATWINALTERRRQIAEGKLIDSYMYSNVKTTEVREKTREESFSYLLLRFKDDPIVADFYVNAAGRIRIGQLFQDLDALAGRIAYRHASPAEPVMVTASVDRIYLLKALETITEYNVVLSGSVVWTGRSSMEIEIKASAVRGELPETIKQESLHEDDTFLTASFTFVARNPVTHKSVPINKLLPLNQKEWVDFRRAESHNAAKKLQAADANLNNNPPTENESSMIHKMWRASKEISKMGEKNRPKGVAFMKETNLKSTMFMQPQYRNRHSYMIFGGYLMRQTFELAYCAASSVSHSLPRFISLDSTTFRAPVPVGSILHMDATVVYTEHIYENSSGSPLSSAAAAAAAAAAASSSSSSSSAEIETAPLVHFQPTPINKLSSNKEDFLSRPGTLIQVKVDTVVQELATDNKTRSGSFIYSFFAPCDSSSCTAGFATVVPETYSEMIEYVQGRRRAIDTAAYASRFKRQSKL